MTVAHVLPKMCICGHDHRTERGEPVSLCLECSCIEQVFRCQNCGAEAVGQFSAMDVCSRRCGLQLDYAIGKAAA